jgi:O-succinylbenzoic acid--CoA ligase
VTRLLRALPMPAGPAVLDLLPRLALLLDGTGDAILPVPFGDDGEAGRLATELAADAPIGTDIAVVVSTSGTTGKPKGAMLTSAALTASGNATHERLGGPGQWLLALPPHHIAGLQVLLRSALAGTQPAVLDVSTGFQLPAFVEAAASMTGERRYISLVATQLAKALEHTEACAALASFDAVLLGGGPLPAPLATRAAEARIAVIRTYGMSETCGGCVYDGVPLRDVRIRVSDTDGRISIGGATIAEGYRNMPDHKAFSEPGWFHTDDAGTMDAGGLRVLGRLDEAIGTGGLTVVPQAVESAAVSHPLVAECAVFGLPDNRLGQRVAIAVVPAAAGSPTLDELREHVTRTLDVTAAPRELHVLDELPRRGIGKVDRRALTERFRDQT